MDFNKRFKKPTNPHLLCWGIPKVRDTQPTNPISNSTYTRFELRNDNRSSNTQVSSFSSAKFRNTLKLHFHHISTPLHNRDISSQPTPQNLRSWHIFKQRVKQQLATRFNVGITESFPFQYTVPLPLVSMISVTSLRAGHVTISTCKLSPPPSFPRGPTDVTLCRLWIIHYAASFMQKPRK